MRLASPPVSLDSFSTARLDAERLTEDHWDDLRRMDQDEWFMAELGGVRDEPGTRAYLERNLAHWQRAVSVCGCSESATPAR